MAAVATNTARVSRIGEFEAEVGLGSEASVQPAGTLQAGPPSSGGALDLGEHGQDRGHEGARLAVDRLRR